jgi:hypothetical protein
MKSNVNPCTDSEIITADRHTHGHETTREYFLIIRVKGKEPGPCPT